MEPELIGKETAGPEKQKPEPNNEEPKQTLEKSTPEISSLPSSASSSSSGLTLEFSVDDEKDDLIESPKLKPISTHPPAGYDPTRIPTSIFSKPPNADDWSSASNESLFSIHMGNNSFTHDQAILYAKSGELGRFDDWSNPGKSPNADMANYSNGLPTVVEEGGASGGPYRAESFSSSHRGKEDDLKKGPLEYNGNSSLNLSSNIDARCSEESGKSDVSFAFPVLVGEGVKTESMRRDSDVTEKPHELQEQVSKKSSDHDTNAPPPQGSWMSRFCCCWPRSG